MSNRFHQLVSTFFYVGYFPKAPGSLATLCGLGICFLLKDHLWLYILVMAVVTAAGFFSAGHAEKMTAEKDPSCIVIDEVSGIMLSFFLLPMSVPVMWTGFFLFRAFDMFKIFPVNKFEEMEGATGIMMDDIFAGVYTNLTMRLALYLVLNLAVFNS